MTRLGAEGHSTWLLYPSARPAAATLDYISKGVDTGVDQAYQCRVRSPWWRVPLLKPADLLLTYMNADTPRLTTNSAGARHLNSVHGGLPAQQRPRPRERRAADRVAELGNPPRRGTRRRVLWRRHSQH